MKPMKKQPLFMFNNTYRKLKLNETIREDDWLTSNINWETALVNEPTSGGGGWWTAKDLGCPPGEKASYYLMDGVQTMWIVRKTNLLGIKDEPTKE